MRTAHVVAKEVHETKIKGRRPNNPYKVPALCGQLVYPHGLHECVISPSLFMDVDRHPRTLIRCGQCMMHEDFPLLLLGDEDG